VLSLDANGTRISRGSRAAELRNLAMRTLSHFSTGTRGTLRPLEGGAASSYMDGEQRGMGRGGERARMQMGKGRGGERKENGRGSERGGVTGAC
jgi:hypothetical protein